MEKRKLRIGIDIDDVVVEYLKSFLDYVEKKEGKKFLYEEIFDYSFQDILGVSREEIWNLVKGHESDEIIINLDLIENSKESIELLNNVHKIFFITSRNTKIKNTTLLFFEKHFPNHNFKILFSGENWDNGNRSKQEICKDYGIEIFIEDNLDYALDCATNGIKVFLIDKPWNQKENLPENIIRVKDWKDILVKIEGLN